VARAVRIGSIILLLLSLVAPLSAQPSDALVVTMNARFDRAVSSSVTKSVARQEAADIWHAYGVEILWNRTVEPALHFEVVVVSTKTEHSASSSFAVLGRTELDHEGSVVGPIRVNYEAIEEVLEFRDTSSPLLREREAGRALGRVLAHEVGHALLGVPAFHDAEGLMRLTIPVDDLVSPDRRFLQLSAASVARLRHRVRCLGDAAASLCPRAGASASMKP